MLIELISLITNLVFYTIIAQFIHANKSASQQDLSHTADYTLNQNLPTMNEYGSPLYYGSTSINDSSIPFNGGVQPDNSQLEPPDNFDWLDFINFSGWRYLLIVINNSSTVRAVASFNRNLYLSSVWLICFGYIFLFFFFLFSFLLWKVEIIIDAKLRIQSKKLKSTSAWATGTR